MTRLPTLALKLPARMMCPDAAVIATVAAALRCLVRVLNLSTAGLCMMQLMVRCYKCH